jgi:hypothetical protein
VTSDAPRANSSTRASSEISSARGTWLASSAAPGIQRDLSKEHVRHIRQRDASTRDSTSSCWNTRARPAPSADADRNFLAARQRPREEKIPHVRAGDQQDEADGGEQHHE